MKKLVVMSMLVLGMASMANAALKDGFIFHVGGLTAPTEITIGPSDVVELDLGLASGWNTKGFTLQYDLSNSQAELICNGATWGPANGHPGLSNIAFPTVFDMPGNASIQLPQQVKITAGQLTSQAVAGPQTLMNELYLHCLEGTDVVLTIKVTASTYINNTKLSTANVDGFPILHTLTIHQIPEPATIALLGLGGLLLRRRKKQ